MAQNTGPPSFEEPTSTTGIIKLRLPSHDLFYQVSNILLDTGSSCNLISRNLVHQLGLIARPLSAPKNLGGVAGGTVSRAWTTLDLHLSGVRVNISLLVLEEPLIYAILLGKPGLRAFGAVIDEGNQMVTVSPGTDASGRALRYVAPIDFQLPPSCVTQLTLDEGRAAASTMGKSPEQFMEEKEYAESFFPN